MSSSAERVTISYSVELSGIYRLRRSRTKLYNYHVFLFPTLGENYGHVILEALSAGCPCIISDQTPWQHLEENQAGFVFPLDQKDRFAAVIDHYAEMTEGEFQKISESAHAYALRVGNESAQTTGYRHLFDSVG